MTTVSDVFGGGSPSDVPAEVSQKDGGAYMGTRLHGRAIVPVTDSDGKWLAGRRAARRERWWTARLEAASGAGDRAVLLWDRIRADVRGLPDGRQDAAWALVVDALQELRVDLVQQFTAGPKGGVR